MERWGREKRERAIGEKVGGTEVLKTETETEMETETEAESYN